MFVDGGEGGSIIYKFLEVKKEENVFLLFLKFSRLSKTWCSRHRKRAGQHLDFFFLQASHFLDFRTLLTVFVDPLRPLPRAERLLSWHDLCSLMRLDFQMWDLQVRGIEELETCQTQSFKSRGENRQVVGYCPKSLR